MRRVVCAAVGLIAACPALPAEPAKDDGSYRIQVTAGVGRFSGYYGEEEKTTLDVVSLSTRWYFDRAEFQVSLPYLRIDGPADIIFIDGQPVGGSDELHALEAAGRLDGMLSASSAPAGAAAEEGAR